MPSAPDKVYLDNVSRETDFLRDPLEKVYRLLELLGTITSAPDIEGKLVLKGGTALQFIYLDFKRLSVDIDFNYIGSLDRDVMQEERAKISDMLSKIFKEYGYNLESNIRSYAEEQYVLGYTNSVGNNDRIKVDINYLERLPVMPVIQKEAKHPFDILKIKPIPTFQYEEIIAQKTRALITRATPRDLYDVHLISQGTVPFDSELYRKLTLFYLSLTSEDVREMTTELITDIDDQDVKRHLAPMLRRRDYTINLDKLKGSCLKLVEPILTLTDDEIKFFGKFYGKKVFEQKLLFGDVKLDFDLSTHPGVQWRFQNKEASVVLGNESND